MGAVILAMVPLMATMEGGAQERDRFGGWLGVRSQATGFFRVEEIRGVWWFITPEGNAFLSKGVNHVSYTADFAPTLGYSPYGRVAEAKYGSAPKWAQAAAQRLWHWGFNTIGAWSSAEMFQQQMPYTLILNLAARAGADWQKGRVADVFSPQFKKAVWEQAERLCRPRAQDPFLLGYFTDNELRWGPDWRSRKTLLEEFLALPPETPGKQAFLRLAQARYGSIQAFNQAWGTQFRDFKEVAQQTSLPLGSEAAQTLQREFLYEYARTYFQVCHEAIRAADPHHLILGCRFAFHPGQEVVEAMKGFVDVVSINNYDFRPPVETFQRLHRTTGRPLLLTEFSFKAMDSGLPNTRGAGRPVPTQRDRADRFEEYVTALMRLPFMVGFHWFEFCDEPAEGRFDGENSNYGLVNIKDEPWEVLVERMARVNPTLEALHASAHP